MLSPEFSTKFRELSIGFVAFDISFVHREDNEAAHRCASMTSKTSPFLSCYGPLPDWLEEIADRDCNNSIIE